MLDVLLMLHYLNHSASFIAKEELFKIFLVGSVLRYGRTIPIARDNLEKAKESIRLAQKYAEEGRAIVIAPEGKRRRKKSISDEVNILDFKKGGFHLAKNARIRVIPFIFVGANRINSSVDSFAMNKGDIHLKIIKPVTVEQIDNMTVGELTEHTRDYMIKNNKTRTDDEILKPNRDNKWWILGNTIFWVWALKTLFVLLLNLFF